MEEVRIYHSVSLPIMQFQNSINVTEGVSDHRRTKRSETPELTLNREGHSSERTDRALRDVLNPPSAWTSEYGRYCETTRNLAVDLFVSLRECSSRSELSTLLCLFRGGDTLERVDREQQVRASGREGVRHSVASNIDN